MILLECMKETIDLHLRDNQARFRQNRLCVHQVATLRILVEQSKERNSPALIIFIDYEKASDSVDHTTLYNVLQHYGLKLVRLIQNNSHGSRCCVTHEG